MPARDEPWQTAEIPGPKKAMVITNPQIVTALIKRSKNPILIAGHKTMEIKFSGGQLIDYVIQLANAANAPVASSPSILGEFIKRGFKRAIGIPVVDIANRLIDANWTGLEGKGQHDLAMFIGFKYYVGWLILSGLKHFSQNIKTISLDAHYQPHALWSFPNLSQEEWEKNIDAVIKSLRGDNVK